MNFLSSSKQVLEDFFEKHQGALKKNYPGLSKSILKEKFQELCSVKNNLDLIQINHQHELNQFFESCLKGVPFAQIIGSQYFYNSDFLINESVLIPRFETEILVFEAIEFLKDKTSAKIVDVGVGPGTILLSILKELNFTSDSLALDISKEALEVLSINSFRLGPGFRFKQNIRSLENDRLNNLNEKFDLIVSNPPYIQKKNDFDGVHHKVSQYEPEVALFIKDENYEQWFLDFFEDAFSKLNSSGAFMMEGHERHLKGQLALLSRIGFNNAELKKDLTGRDRFLIAYKS